jgi:Peptidase S24-like
MARRKTLPDSVRAKRALAERLAALRSELLGERGGPEMARQLGIPVRTWYNYEGGVTVPAEVILRIIELTSVEPTWLLHGNGPKFRQAGKDRGDALNSSTMTVGALLRTALQLLEDEKPRIADGNTAEDSDTSGSNGLVKLDFPNGDWDELGEHDPEKPALNSLETVSAEARHDWLAARQENRCIEVAGDAMSPVLADGASVAFSSREEDVRQLDNKMVVFWHENQPIVRWFQHCGRYALLRAENPKTAPPQVLVDLEDPDQHTRFRRVLRYSTTH